MRSVIGMIAHGVSILTLAAALLACATGRAPAGVLLQGYFVNVPAPTPAHPNVDFWWDHIAKQAKALREAGFTAVWLPPVCKANGGTYSVGFDPFDDYDLGSKDQKGTIPTRYGTREQLERCVAILRANGLDVYVDLVENHRDGGNHQKYRYVDADGKPDGGVSRRIPATSTVSHQEAAYAPIANKTSPDVCPRTPTSRALTAASATTSRRSRGCPTTASTACATAPTG